MMKALCIAALAFPVLWAQDSSISAERIRAHGRFLASDLLEGRGVGQRGGDLATEYIATQFALAGAKPAGDNGTYFQRVPLVGVETQPESELSAVAGSKVASFRWLQDFVGVSQTQQVDTKFDVPAVFAGHGITAQEFRWDDFKGMDVTGKLLVIFTNEPPSDDPKFFDGRALTFYGRWVYKYEEAVRRGARGLIMIHTSETAGYGWDVVRSTFGGETKFVKLAPGQPSLAFAGWMTREAGERLLALAGIGKTVDELLAASNKPDFKPIPLNLHIRGHLTSKVRELKTSNVAAIVEGSDPVLRREVVIFSAHWDHFGIGASVNGDSIYNGAIDNATGCAILMELARAWAALPVKPKRSALFLSVTAEEGGHRGSEYYAAHPFIPAPETAIDLNYDAVFPWGRAKDVVITGAERTTVYPLAQQIAAHLNLEISPDSEPEQGSYFRSDHFSFVRAGIPAFSIGAATEFVDKPAGYGHRMWLDYHTNHYHRPSDEFQEDWDFTALAQAAEYGFALGRDIANQEKLPDWRPGGGFHR
jgi:hypothetical protein